MSEFLPWDDISPEREEELIDSFAKHIVRYGLEEAAEVFLESIRPVTRITAMTTLWIGSPVLEFFGVPGYDYSKLFRKRETVDRLIKRIYEIQKERRPKR